MSIINSEGNNLKDMWAKIRSIVGNDKKYSNNKQCNITAEELNDHYCKISTDGSYDEPNCKITVPAPNEFVTEQIMFNAISYLKPTADGPDKIPSWFLKTANAYISAP